MHYLSRRFSGFVYLYFVLAGIAIQLIFILQNVILQNLFRNNIEGYSIFHYAGYFLIILITFIVLIITLIIMARRKYPIAKLLRINTFSFLQFISVIFISIFIYLFSRTFNSLLIKWIDALIFNYNVTCFNSDISLTMLFVADVIIVCLIPAFVQGFIFPGAVQTGLHDYKPFKSCLLAGMLFALFLQINSFYVSPLSIFYYLPDIIVCFMFCYICFRSNSIIPGIIAIFIYHLLISINFGNWLYYLLYPAGLSDIVTAESKTMDTLVAVIFLAISIVAGGLLIWKFPKNKKGFKTIDKQVVSGWFHRLKKSISNLSWLPEEVSEKRPAVKLETAADTNNEIIIYPDDSEKQKKNTGFVIAVVIQVFLIIANVVFYIVYRALHNLQ